VITMFVRNKDRVERVPIHASRGQSLEGLLAAQARINEETGPLGRDQCGVTGA
jgi:hypothetical protein